MPTTGWYEWQKIDAKTKQPYHFRPAATPFAFGGVYDVWKGGDKVITSFSIVTTAAAPSTSAYHDRMPLALEDGQFDDWMRGPPELAAGMMALRRRDRGVACPSRGRQRAQQSAGADRTCCARTPSNERIST